MQGNATPPESVETVILGRLTEDHVPVAQASLVLAALISADELAHAVGGQRPARELQAVAVDAQQSAPSRAYLKAIRVAGFRGIGPARELRLASGPGLTLVIGRNGSGKSSFAEAAELALTGDNKRWSGKTQVWRLGWRNLHAGKEPQIDVELAIEGEAKTVTVAREWADGADLGAATAYIQAGNQQRLPLSSLGWATALEVYRPFLSYSELGDLVNGTPSAMHDALESILGLDQLTEAEHRLNEHRRHLEAASKVAKQALPVLLARLAAHPDERARAAERALGGKAPNLAALTILGSGGDDPADAGTARLRHLAALALPTVDQVTTALQHLTAAQELVAWFSGTEAGSAQRLAGLLSAALDHHGDHPGAPCPVCGGRALDEEWASVTQEEVARLTSLAQDASAAQAELINAQKALTAVVGPKPPMLAALPENAASSTAAPEIRDPASRAASTAWDRWDKLVASGQATKSVFLALDSAVADLNAAASHTLAERSEAWQPIAVMLADWIAKHRESQRATAILADVKAAADWLRKTGSQVRNERLAPFTEGSARVWAMLRQESNVDLGPVTLAGTGNKRHVSLEVTVDGIEGAALSVMSQGELHALGLALFLPRATAASSPFGFLVIDDPVQSMDPAKVDGLARVLSQYAATRQVVVFTHDDRLPASLRQLQLPATIWEVTRREHSEVSLKKRDDPVSRYIEDALTLAQTRELDDGIKAVAVAGMCRYALEAACIEVVRRRRIGAGVPHTDVEEVLEKAGTLRQKLALALFNDAEPGGEVKPALNRLGGPSRGQAFVAVFNAAREGTHEPYPGDLKYLARETEKLTRALRGEDPSQ